MNPVKRRGWSCARCDFVYMNIDGFELARDCCHCETCKQPLGEEEIDSMFPRCKTCEHKHKISSAEDDVRLAQEHLAKLLSEKV